MDKIQAQTKPGEWVDIMETVSWCKEVVSRVFYIDVASLSNLSCIVVRYDTVSIWMNIK